MVGIIGLGAMFTGIVGGALYLLYEHGIVW